VTTTVVRQERGPLRLERGGGFAGPAAVTIALGALGQSVVGVQGRQTGESSTLLYWVSLVLIFVPAVAVIVSRRSTGRVRVAFAVATPLVLLLTRLLLFPTSFDYHDELIHVSLLHQIASTGHLFSPSSLLPSAPMYPGLEIVTSAIQALTRLSEHTSGLLALGLARLLMTVCILEILRRVTKSTTLAALGAMVYVANPQYLWFNGQFSYQSMALPLSFFAVVLVERSRRPRATVLLALTATFVAVAASHHLTSIALVCLLWVWFLFARLRRHDANWPWLLRASLLATAVVGCWSIFASGHLAPYLHEMAVNNVSHLIDLLHGKTDHKFFTDAAGDTTPTWERLLSLSSVLVIMLCLVPALWRQWTARRALSAAALTLTLIAVMYPMIPAGHLTNATAEVADRASGFIFVGLAYLLPIWWYRPAQRHPGTRPARPRFPRLPVLATIGLAVLFVGGTVVGSGPAWQRVPGAYLVSAENRSVDDVARQAASWEAARLRPGSRVFTDRMNGLLAAAYGNMHVLTNLGDGIDLWSASTLILRGPEPADVPAVTSLRAAYVIADARLATSLPHVGIYIDTGEYEVGMRTSPPPSGALVKFDDVEGAARIFDNGSIRIYDVTRVR
jgi:hypothetical protein